MFETEITKLLGIKYPIFQGGMAWVANYNLAGAVSNAGGLGIIASGSLPGDIIREEIRQLKRITDKPFGVNIMLMSPYAEDIVDIVCEEGVPVVTTGAGNPGKYIEKLKAHNVKIIPVVPTVSLARRLERQGVDAIIAEGTEAGGHIGEIATMALVPQIVDAVEIPVISAGGIGDGRGFVAALALGAEGVQLGTRFVCSAEAEVHENFKNQIIEAKDRDALVAGRSTGHPIRILRNKFSKEYLEREKAGNTLEELGRWSAGRLKLIAQKGDTDKGSLMAGQISGLIEEIKTCEAIIEDIVKIGSQTISRLALLNEVKKDE